MTILVSFRLPAEYIADATGGILIGEFNNWDPSTAIEMVKNDDGSLETAIPLEAGKVYQYRYLLNNGHWVNDNRNTTWANFCGYPVENSLVEVPSAIASVQPKKITDKTSASTGKTTPDDLLKIQGIDRKIIAMLKKQDVITYRHLGKLTIKGLRDLISASGYSAAKYNPTTWPKQARLAATEKWDELLALQAVGK